MQKNSDVLCIRIEFNEISDTYYSYHVVRYQWKNNRQIVPCIGGFDSTFREERNDDLLWFSLILEQKIINKIQLENISKQNRKYSDSAHSDAHATHTQVVLMQENISFAACSSIFQCLTKIVTNCWNSSIFNPAFWFLAFLHLFFNHLSSCAFYFLRWFGALQQTFLFFHLFWTAVKKLFRELSHLAIQIKILLTVAFHCSTNKRMPGKCETDNHEHFPRIAKR